MDKIIVTGANGYIGRNFIKYAVEQGIEVYAIDRNKKCSILNELNNVKFFRCDMENIDSLNSIISEKKYMAFYHFAWNGAASNNINRAKYEAQIENIKNSCNAAVISKKLNCNKFITTGSIVEKATTDLSELNNVTDSFYYGIAKNCLHEYLKAICKINKINFVWATLPNIYGGSNGAIISYMLDEFKYDRTPIFGPCIQPYNFTYIKDIVRALLFIGQNNTECSEYLLSNGECRKLHEFLEEVSELLSKEIKIGIRKDDGLVFKKEWFDNSKLTDLGFKPQYSFIDGVKEMLDNQMKE